MMLTVLEYVAGLAVAFAIVKFIVLPAIRKSSSPGGTGGTGRNSNEGPRADKP